MTRHQVKKIISYFTDLNLQVVAGYLWQSDGVDQTNKETD